MAKGISKERVTPKQEEMCLETYNSLIYFFPFTDICEELVCNVVVDVRDHTILTLYPLGHLALAYSRCCGYQA